MAPVPAHIPQDKRARFKANMVAFSSALLARMKVFNKVGMQFGTDRDLYEKLGYKRNLEFDDYFQRYQRGGVAKRIIEVAPKATWRNVPLVDQDLQDNKKQKFDKDWARLAQRLKLFHYLKRADIVAGICEYAVLLIGVRDGQPLSSPLTKVSGPESIVYLSVYSQNNAQIASINTDPGNSRFGLPETYKITAAKDISALGGVSGKDQKLVTGLEIIVHHSRVIHVADGLREDDIYGIPRLQAVWNYLDDLDKVIGGSAEAQWKGVWKGIQFDVDKDMEMDEDDEAAFSDELDEWEHGMRRFIRTRGMKATPLGADVVDPTGMTQPLFALIAGTVETPSRLLFGSERGELASTTDERTFNANIKERQVDFAEMKMLRPLVDKFIEIGALPKPKEDKYDVQWPDVSILTHKEKADVAARIAQATLNISKQATRIMDPAEFRRDFLGLAPVPEGPDVFEQIRKEALAAKQTAPGQPTDVPSDDTVAN